MNKPINYSACPICKNDIISLHINTVDFFSSQEKFSIDFCNNCNLRFTNPRPRDSDLTAYYDSENYISHSANAKGYINQIYKVVQHFNFFLKYKSVLDYVPRGTWLDYGCGNGAFIEYLNKKNIPVFGYEPNLLATSHLTSSKIPIVNNPEDIPSSIKFATIMMWHVLEHVPDPVDTLRQHHSLLAKKGKLILALPNYESWDAQYYQEYWAAYDTPRHLWHYNQSTIEAQANSAGFKLLKVKPLFLDAFYVSMLSEKYKKGNSVNGIIQGVKSNILALQSKLPYSSQVYIFEKRP